jgi:hypothetical protein
LALSPPQDPPWSEELRIAEQTIEDLGEQRARMELSFRAVTQQLGAIENRLEELEYETGLKRRPI